MKSFFWAMLISITLSGQDYKPVLDKLMKGQQQLFNMFLPLTGFDSYDELKNFLNKHYPTRVKQFDNDLVLAILAPSSVRTSILKNGFKNQFETNTSRGLLNNTSRFNVERSLLGYSSKQYSNIPIEIRPKYGFVTTKKNLIKIAKKLSCYGDDIYIIKNSTTSPITWTPGDSLNRIWQKCNDFISDCASWADIFIPWRYRHILIPYLRDHDIESVKIPNKKVITPKNQFNPIAGSYTNSEYMEFQIWGPAPIDIVETFIYTQKKLSHKQLRRLNAAGIANNSSKEFKSAVQQ